MINNVGMNRTAKTHTVKELYAEAIRQMKEEVRAMKRAPLTEEETAKLEQLAKSVSHEVLKEMRIF